MPFDKDCFLRPARGPVLCLAATIALWCLLAGIVYGGLFIGHEASMEASRVHQENFRAAPRAISMASMEAGR